MSKEMVMNILADRVIGYHPDLARACGGVKAAVFLSQMLYWTGKGTRGDGLIWKTQSDIEGETGLSKHEQRTARKALTDRGILHEELRGIPAKLHYRVDTEVLYAVLEEFYRGRSQQDVENPDNKERTSTATITESTAQSTTTCSDEAQTASSSSDETLEEPHVENQHEDNGGATLTEEPDPREMFSAVIEACDWSLATLTGRQRGQANQTEKVLRKAGATPPDIRAFRSWWDAHDWRGEEGSPPRPHQIREEWGTFIGWGKDDGPGFINVTQERINARAAQR